MPVNRHRARDTGRRRRCPVEGILFAMMLAIAATRSSTFLGPRHGEPGPPPPPPQPLTDIEAAPSTARAALTEGALTTTAATTNGAADGPVRYAVVLSTFDRLESALRATATYLRCDDERLAHVHVVWQDPKAERHAEARLFEKLPDPRGRLRLHLSTTNRLSNRFAWRDDFAATEALFSTDDDMLYPCRYLGATFDIWLKERQQADAAGAVPPNEAIVGFAPRLLEMVGKEKWGPFKYNWMGAYANWGSGYNTVFITKGGMVHRSLYSTLDAPEWADARRAVDEATTAEDMLASAAAMRQNFKPVALQGSFANIRPDVAALVDADVAVLLRAFQERGKDAASSGAIAKPLPGLQSRTAGRRDGVGALVHEALKRAASSSSSSSSSSSASPADHKDGRGPAMLTWDEILRRWAEPKQGAGYGTGIQKRIYVMDLDLDLEGRPKPTQQPFPFTVPTSTASDASMAARLKRVCQNVQFNASMPCLNGGHTKCAGCYLLI